MARASKTVIKPAARLLSFLGLPVGTYRNVIERPPIEKGSAIYIPKGVWHGVENPDRELLLLWVVAPPGLEAFFREVASAPGAPPRALTCEQLNEIAQKHGMQLK